MLRIEAKEQARRLIHTWKADVGQIDPQAEANLEVLISFQILETESAAWMAARAALIKPRRCIINTWAQPGIHFSVTS